MVLHYYNRLENPNRTMDLKLCSDELGERIVIPDELNYYDNDEWLEYLDEERPRIIFPNDLNSRKSGKIVTSDSAGKMHPDDRRRAIIFLRKCANSRLESRDITIKLQPMASYIAPTGELIDITSGHKGNNFRDDETLGFRLLEDEYLGIRANHNSSRLSVASQRELNEHLTLLIKHSALWDQIGINNPEYSRQLSGCLCNFLLPIAVIKQINILKDSETDLEVYERHRKTFYQRLLKLRTINNVDSGDIVEFFNFVGAHRMRSILLQGKEVPGMSADYSEEIRQNIIGLLAGKTAIMDCFIQIKKYINNPTEIIRYIFNKDLPDFLVQMVGFDKIETQRRRTITTSRLNIYESFYNYLIMGWKVYQLYKYQVNREYGVIERVDNASPFCLINNSPTEREYKREIDKVLKLPIDERYKYLI